MPTLIVCTVRPRSESSSLVLLHIVFFKTNADGHEDDDDDDDHVNDEDDVDDDIIHICVSLYHNRTVPHDCDKVCHVVKFSFLLCLIIQGAMRNLPQQCSDVVEDRAQ